MQTDAFLVHARLGAGTTGAAFRATRPTDGRQVLLKALHAEFVRTLDVDHLREVVVALARVEHHAIASNVDLVRWRGDLVLVRDMIRGVDLATIVAGSAPPKKVALTITAEIAGALAAVKAMTGHIHGDLKPSNVFIDTQGDVRVVDFGLARALPEQKDHTLTMFHGSVGFMSPERADKQMSEGTDIYSLALMLAWMFTGEMPRRTSANPKRHAKQRAQLLERVRANGADDEVIDLIERCSAYTPDERPTIDEVARILAVLAERTEGPRVISWAGPLVNALVVLPTEFEISDVGQSLSATAVPAPRVGSNSNAPVDRISTGAQELPEASSGPSPKVLIGGAVAVLLAVAMLAGALAIASQGT